MTMTRQENIFRRSEVLNRLRSPFGVPVGCEISVEVGSDGSPVILSSVEVERSSGVRILSQSEVDEREVLLRYRQWRSDPENRGRIRRFGYDLTEC